MSEITWHFTKQTPDMKSRNAMQQKFFELDKAMVVSLVRESIQNSLDAKDTDVEGPVNIRIFISGQEHALSREQTSLFLTDTAWQHFNVRDNGLDSIRPSRNESCHFIVIEDFGTKGLNGNILEWSKPENTQNHFYHFFRAEGESDKGLTKASRGKHGVGKIVFPMTSRLKTFFGLTVRKEDNKKYLVGQCVLKHHKLESIPFTPDGWFGYLNGDQLPMPIDYDFEPEILREFSSTFNLKRTTENGLSVVIPYVSEEIENHAIVHAIIEDYFWAILNENLVISIISPQEAYSIEKGSLLSAMATLKLDNELKAKIELAKWASEIDTSEIVTINTPQVTSPPEWAEELIDPKIQVQLRKKLEAEERIALRIPLVVRKKEGDRKEIITYYDVFIQRQQEAKTGRAVFIREGIIIPNASRKRTPGTLAIVNADDASIAAFLGDAEGPAHTEWSSNTEDFKNKYIYGGRVLSFIKNTVLGIINILDESSKQEDKTLLLDFFSIPIPSEGPKRESKQRKKNEKGDTSEEPPDIPPSKPKRYKVRKVQGGFTVSKGDKPISPSAVLDVKVFYDRRGGKPRYNINDFRLEKKPLRIDSKGLKLIQRKENRLMAEILKEDFNLTIKGFDPNRDLFVKVSINEQEPINAEI